MGFQSERRLVGAVERDNPPLVNDQREAFRSLSFFLSLHYIELINNMKLIMENWNKYLLNESSLSRVHQYIMKHNTAMISAWRNDPLDTSMCVGGSATPPVVEHGSQKKEINGDRNKDLKGTLLSLGYGVTPVDGNFIENYGDLEKMVEVKEDSFFVVNLKDDQAFFDVIEDLGQKFCQDSVLMIPQGGKEAYLLGTNYTAFPGFGNRELVGNFLGGHEAEFLSRVGGRPFIFKEGKNEYNLEVYEDHSRNARMAIRSIAKRILKR